MKLRSTFLGLALLLAVSLGRAAPPADTTQHGKTVRVKTGTCIIFDVEEILSPTGATTGFAVAGVWVLPTPDSKFYLGTGRSLIGATVTGVTITTKEWNVSVEVSHLAIKPKTSAAPLTNEELAFALELEIGADFSAALGQGTLPPGTIAPLISAAGLSSGTGTVIALGRGATILTPLTSEAREREAEKRAAESKPAGAR